MGETILHKDTEPYVLATYVLLAASAEWPDTRRGSAVRCWTGSICL